MSFLTDASLVFIPSGYKEDKAYSIKPTDGSGDLTFARASDGTRVNSEGYIERVPWNLLQQSNTFNTTWTNFNSTETGGQSGYDGSSDAWLLTKTGANGNINQVVSSKGVTTLSVYAKSEASDYILIRIGSIVLHEVYFDLANGTIGSQTNVIDSNIESVGNGYYRCSITANVSSGTYIRFYVADDDGDTSGTSGSIYIQDAQLNYGTLKPYFPTTNRQDVPRLTYEGGCPSLLLEPQRTNSVLYGEQFDNAAWGKSYTGTGVIPVVTANQAISPDGTQNADKIILDKGAGATSGDYSFIQQGTTISGDATASIWLKSATSSSYLVSLRLVNTISTVTVTPEWQRFTLTVTGTTSPTFGIWLRGGYGSSDYAEFYAWGAQAEAGSYPTSYIPTTSAAVTRLVDYCYNNSMSDLIGQSEGVIFWEGTIQNTVNPILVQLIPSSGGYTNSIYLEYTGGNIQAKAYDSGSTQALLSTSATIGTRYKIAFAYAQNDFVAYVNGTNIGSDSSGTVQSGLSQIYVGGLKGAFTEAFMGTKLNQLALFKTRLTNDQLEVLTGDSYQSYTAMADALTYYYD